ncbi:MAG: hypothetical protein HDR80_04820 [Bacteroides sp.]|nr:hypothetical protein [Bacteroides sp.]
MKTSTILTASSLLATASLSKLETSEKFALIRAAEALRAHAEAYQSAVRAASERLRPEDFDEIARKEREGIDRTPEELRAVMDYNREMTAFVAEEETRDITPSWPLIEEPAFGRLLDSNPDLKLADILALKQTLVSEAGTPASENPE